MFGVWGEVSCVWGPGPKRNPSEIFRLGRFCNGTSLLWPQVTRRFSTVFWQWGSRPRLLRSGQPRRVGFAVKLRS